MVLLYICQSQQQNESSPVEFLPCISSVFSISFAALSLLTKQYCVLAGPVVVVVAAFQRPVH